jgi:hypothetical protein
MWQLIAKGSTALLRNLASVAVKTLNLRDLIPARMDSMIGIKRIFLAVSFGGLCSCSENTRTPSHPEAIQQIIDTFFSPVTVVDANIDLGISYLKTDSQLQSEEIIEFMEKEGWDIHQRVDVISASLKEESFLYKITISPKESSIRISVSR